MLFRSLMAWEAALSGFTGKRGGRYTKEYVGLIYIQF